MSSFFQPTWVLCSLCFQQNKSNPNEKCWDLPDITPVVQRKRFQNKHWGVLGFKVKESCTSHPNCVFSWDEKEQSAPRKKRTLQTHHLSPFTEREAKASRVPTNAHPSQCILLGWGLAGEFSCWFSPRWPRWLLWGCSAPTTVTVSRLPSSAPRDLGLLGLTQKQAMFVREEGSPYFNRKKKRHY